LRSEEINDARLAVIEHLQTAISDADDWVDFSSVELKGVYQAPHRRAGAHGQATAVVER
jgi:hypothetical protein